MQAGAAVPNEGALMLAHMEVSHMVRALPPATCQTPLLTLIVAASAARRPFFYVSKDDFAMLGAALPPHTADLPGREVHAIDFWVDLHPPRVRHLVGCC